MRHALGIVALLALCHGIAVASASAASSPLVTLRAVRYERPVGAIAGALELAVCGHELGTLVQLVVGPVSSKLYEVVPPLLRLEEIAEFHGKALDCAHISFVVNVAAPADTYEFTVEGQHMRGSLGTPFSLRQRLFCGNPATAAGVALTPPSIGSLVHSLHSAKRDVVASLGESAQAQIERIEAEQRAAVASINALRATAALKAHEIGAALANTAAPARAGRTVAPTTAPPSTPVPTTTYIYIGIPSLLLCCCCCSSSCLLLICIVMQMNKGKGGGGGGGIGAALGAEMDAMRTLRHEYDYVAVRRRQGAHASVPYDAVTSGFSTSDGEEGARLGTAEFEQFPLVV